MLPGGWEWMVILIVALLLFGNRLPSVMRSLGRSVTEFKKGLSGIEDEVKKPAEETGKAEAKSEKKQEESEGQG